MFSFKLFMYRKVMLVLLLILNAGCGQKIEELANKDRTLPVAVKDEANTTSLIPVSMDVSLNDTDPANNLDNATVTVGIAIGGVCSAVSPMVTFTPVLGFAGVGSCQYSICDDVSNCSSGVFEVTVLDTNPPVASTDYAITIVDSATNPIDVTLNDSDPEGTLDYASVSILTSPAAIGGSCSLSPASPQVVFTPTASFFGTGTCSYEVCDIAVPANCATGMITVEIRDAVNPVAVNDMGVVQTGSSLSTDVSVNDSDSGTGLDLASVSVEFAIGGTCAVATSPNVDFTPSSNFLGNASCGYKICDTSLNCSSATLVVEVSDGVSPVASPDSLTTSSGITSSPLNVSLNDSDAENNLDFSSVTILASPAPVGGTCSITTSPNMTFTPTSGYSGVGSCTYEICDNGGNCASETVSVNILDAGTPVAVDDIGAAVSGGTGVTVDLSANDTDPEGNLDTSTMSLTYAIGGVCTFDTAAPNVKFVQEPGFIGSASCGYEICDASNNCDTASFLVTVADGVSPVANIDTSSTSSGVATSAINLALNDSDPENNLDLSSVTILTTPAAIGGTCAVTTSPNVVFTPNAGFAGSASCAYEICDQATNCTSSSLNVEVIDETNPVAMADSDTMTSADPGVTVDVSANDTDNVALDDASVTLTYAIGGACTFDTASPNVLFVPQSGFIGTGSCGYKICDDTGNCDSSNLGITVTDGNGPIAGNDIISTNENTTTVPTNVSLNDTDIENNLDISSVSILASPAAVGGVCTVTTSPNVVFSPNAGFIGLGSCQYEICDNAMNCSDATLEIQVNGPAFPLARNDVASTLSGSTGVTLDVSANDSDPQNDLDLNSVTISFSVNGVCSLDTASPNVKFVPNSGFFGAGSCGYQICDDVSNCAIAVLNVDVKDGQPPVATVDSFSTQSETVSSEFNVATNDTDPESNLDLSSVSILPSPAPIGGSCVVTNSPLIQFTPNSGFTGTASCSYQICDYASSPHCDSAIVNIVVTDASSPMAIADNAVMDTSLANVVTDVLVNDSDPENNIDNSTLSIIASSGGACTVSTPNITFDPDPEFIGSGSCTYEICDTSSNCSTSSLTIAVNDGVAPVANNDTVTLNSGLASNEVNVTSNDVDPESNMNFSSVAVLLSPAPVGGTCTVTSSPLVQFNPSAGFSGTGSCTYEVCDNATNCTSATLTAVVNDATSPAVVADVTNMNTSLANISFDVLANDNDPENNLDTSSLSIASAVGGSCTVASPNITFDPDPGFIGTGLCSYEVCDLSSNCSNSVLSIAVTDGVAPITNDDSISVASGTASPEINVLSNDTDPETNIDSTSVAILMSPAAVGGACTVTSSPLVQFTPTVGFTGVGGCSYEVCDNASNCSSANIVATVSDSNPPVANNDTGTINTSATNVTVDVVDNDTDIENGIDLSSLSVSFSVGGTCVAATPNITFTPSSGFTGSASCGYLICDNGGNCDSATLAITVVDGSPPIANSDVGNTNSGVTSGAINVASNDLDPEGRLDLASVSVLSSPAAVGGTCSAANSPFITFTPSVGFSGSGSCAYEICDLDGNCAASSVAVLVIDNNPPVVVKDVATVNQNTATAAFDVSGNDSDLESNLDPSSVSLVAGSEVNGTCDVTAPNIIFTPSTDFAGIGSCEYEICDSSSNCSNEIFEVTVNDITKPTVVINQDPVQADPTNNLPIIFSLTFSEPILTSSFTVADINTTASTATGGIYSIVNSGDDKNFNIFVYALTSNGDVTLSLDAGVVEDKNAQTNIASSSTDNTVAYDATAPTGLEINNWVWAMSSPDDASYSPDGTPQITLVGAAAENGGSVQVFDNDICLSAQGSSQTIASGAASFSDMSYATDGSEDGLKTFYVTVTDSVGNVSGCTPIGLEYTLDNIKPDLLISQVATQSDPTNIEPIVFEFEFSEEIDPATFEVTDIVETGTAVGGTYSILTSTDNRVFTVTVNGINTDGTLVPELAAGLVSDLAGNTNTIFTATDNSVTYDTTAPEINITSVPAIILANEAAWPLGGTCSEVGREVEVILEPGNIPGNIRPLDPIICQPDGTWTTVIDTRSISSDGEYFVQAIHDDVLLQSSTTDAAVYRAVMCTSPPLAITDLEAANIAQQSVDLLWSTPGDGGTPITDYVVEFRDIANTYEWDVFPDLVSPANSLSVTSLNTSTLYEFRVRAETSPFCYADVSNIIEVLTRPNHPMFDSFDYELVNLSGSEENRIVALEDGTSVRVFNSPADYRADIVAQIIPMDAGDVNLLTSSKGMVVQSVKPIYVSGKLQLDPAQSSQVYIGNTSWASPSWAEKVLVANLTRWFPGEVNIYNFEPDATITLYVGNTVLATQSNVAADSVITMTIPNTAPSNSTRSFRIESTGFIFATIFGRGSTNTAVIDDMPFLPAAKKVFAQASRSGYIATPSTTTVPFTVYHANGVVENTVIGVNAASPNSCLDSGNPLTAISGAFTRIYPYSTSDGEQYCNSSVSAVGLFKSDVSYIEADGKISGNNTADGDGGNSAPFIPSFLKKRRYAINCKSGFLFFASDVPAVIDEINQAGVTVATHTLIRSGAGPYVSKTPYQIRLTGNDLGNRFEGQGPADKFVGWMQCVSNTADPLGNGVGFSATDETLLYGYD